MFTSGYILRRFRFIQTITCSSRASLGLSKRVVRYVSGSASTSIFYSNNPSNCKPLTAYCDSDWGGCQDTRRSTTGIIIKRNKAPVYWTSKRQSLVTLSSTEAEYVAISSCGKEISWLRNLLMNFYTMVQSKTLSCPIQLYYILTVQQLFLYLFPCRYPNETNILKSSVTISVN